jgi:hypothetical protein
MIRDDFEISPTQRRNRSLSDFEVQMKFGHFDVAQDSKTDSAYLRFVPALCIGVLLIFTFRLYTFAYFWLDDFNNLHWVQSQSFTQMLWYVVNPASDFFRPVGMMFYWIALQLFDRDALAYHYFLWALHTINVGLVYWILQRFTNSHAGAAVGTMVFASQYVLNDLYWSFGTIFEVVGAMFYFTGILLWSRERQSSALVVLASLVFLLALKAKEMTITLPAIWLAYDLLIRRNLGWRMFAHLATPAVLGAWYGFRKMTEMQATYREHPYYMDLTSLTLGRGFGGYFNMFFTTQWRWQFWAIGFTVILLLFAIAKKRLAVFFQLYIFITFLPLIFLINHREFFYWYFPMLGICGLVALLVRNVTAISLRFIPKRMVAPLACALFVLLCRESYARTRDLTEERRLWQHGIAREHRAFVMGLQQLLPVPGFSETLFFKSYPQLFDNGVLLFATQVALRRTDLDTQAVDTFPPGARYRLRFENSQLIAEHY